MKKTGYFFLCFLPMIISVSLQVILSFPMMGLSMMQTCISNLIAGKKPALDELVTQLYARWSSENFTMTLSIVFSICCILLFGFWYTYQFEGRLKQSPKNFLNVPVVLSLIFIVPGLQLFSSILTGLSASVFPNWMKFYEKLMETAGFSDNPSILLFFLCSTVRTDRGRTDLPRSNAFFGKACISFLGSKHFSGSPVWYFPLKCDPEHICIYDRSCLRICL